MAAEPDELKDEVEAINAIYGEGTLVPSPDAAVYVLSLPGKSSSLRLQFPLSYPAVPLTVLGPQTSGGRRGTGERDLELFVVAVATSYSPGQVCLFDAIEEFARLNDASTADGEVSGLDDLAHKSITLVAPEAISEREDSPAEIPPWVISDVVTELKSTFVARCATVSSPKQAMQFTQHLLASDKKVRIATHNITAWRIKGPGGASFQDCDDDGETAAGGRLLHLMQLMDIWDAMIIVTRWYGGQKLGPRRFAVINQVARDSFVKAGLVADGSTKKKSSGK
jgi:hypothetical protein